MNIHETFEAWAPADGPWSPWAKPVLFAHGPSRIMVPPPGSLDQSALVWLESLRQRTAFVLDLPGIMSVNVAVQLAQYGFRPVPLFNTTDGLMPVVDVDEIRSQLYAQAAVVSTSQLPVDAPPVFMLDWYRKTGQHPLTPGHFDNRWVVFPQDFPSGGFLREHGIENVVIWQQFGDQPAEDLAHVARRWQEAGLAIWTKRINPAEAPATITVDKPAWYRNMLQRIVIAMGLRHNSSGGFGSMIPIPSSGGYG